MMMIMSDVRRHDENDRSLYKHFYKLFSVHCLTSSLYEIMAILSSFLCWQFTWYIVNAYDLQSCEILRWLDVVLKKCQKRHSYTHSHISFNLKDVFSTATLRLTRAHANEKKNSLDFHGRHFHFKTHMQINYSLIFTPSFYLWHIHRYFYCL